MKKGSRVDASIVTCSVEIPKFLGDETVTLRWENRRVKCADFANRENIEEVKCLRQSQREGYYREWWVFYYSCTQDHKNIHVYIWYIRLFICLFELWCDGLMNISTNVIKHYLRKIHKPKFSSKRCVCLFVCLII